MKVLYKNLALRRSIDFSAIQFALVVMLMFGVTNISVAVTRTCRQEEAMKAMSEASNLKTWAEVFDSYKKYKQCDDGAIAEGYSSSVAYLLASRWADINTLIKLSNANPDFRRFVIKHVDETMNIDQAKSIKKNIVTCRPAKAKKLCVEIQKRFVELGF